MVGTSFAELSWLGAAPDPAAWEASRRTLVADPRYLAGVDRSTPHFEPGSGRVVVALRVA